MASSIPSKTLGRLSAQLMASLGERDQRTFTIDQAATILGTSPKVTKDLVYHLVRRKWLRRLERGKYMILPLASGLEGRYTEHEFLIAASLINPYYISFWTALNHYGFTEQVARTIFVATTKQKRPVEVSSMTFQFIRLSENKFFGFIQEWIENQQVNIASREKTITDCLDLPQYCGGIVEATKGLWYGHQEKNLDWATLTDYAERMGNRTIFKRLGYLTEALELPIGDYISLWRSKISLGYGRLDPTMKKTGSYNTRWNLFVNVSPEELLEWRVH